MWLAMRYGLNQACSWSPRAWASRTAVPSGSQPGSRPWVPVRNCDQGSYGEGHRASAVGRTWRITVFSRLRTARSRWATSSARWAATPRPGREGQSRFSTVAIHTPRISTAARAPGAPVAPRTPRAVGTAGVAPVVAAAHPPAVSADTAARVKARRDMGPIRTSPYARDPHDHGSSSWRRMPAPTRSIIDTSR
ncbi:hypothetical protein SGPA1_20249 [Streptomyces misionensis JCM 4497]